MVLTSTCAVTTVGNKKQVVHCSGIGITMVRIFISCSDRPKGREKIKHKIILFFFNVIKVANGLST